MEPRTRRQPMAADRFMSAFGRGDVRAVEELFVRSGPRLFGIGLRWAHQVDLASALVELNFLRLWQLAARFSASSQPLDTWAVRQALAVAPTGRPGSAYTTVGLR